MTVWSSGILVLQQSGGCHVTGCAVLGLVRLNGTIRVDHLIRKGQATGHVEYWKAQCGESRTLRLGGGKERKLLPIRTKIEEERYNTGQYLNDIGARRLLTAEEELCMAMQIKAGDEQVSDSSLRPT